jgi:hypothetical protein
MRSKKSGRAGHQYAHRQRSVLQKDFCGLPESGDPAALFLKGRNAYALLRSIF